MRIPPPRRAWLTHLATFAAGAVFATALAAHAVPRSGSRTAERYRSLDAFAQSLAYISSSYVDEVDERALLYGAIRGMVERLDKHSSFLPPDTYRRLRQDTEGEFGGVGIRLASGSRAQAGDRGAHRRDPGAPVHPVIDAVVARSPAARAGIRAGDRLVAIDGEATDERRMPPPDQARGQARGARDVRAWHSALRGVSGTRVSVTVHRAGWPRARTFDLVRERVKVPTVSWLEVSPGVGYLKIARFQEATAADTEAALRALDSRGMRALILDLRGNPGGLLDQAVRVADLFLDEGTIVTIRGRTADSTEREVAHRAGSWTRFGMIALVDQSSASAAEILAAALQDHRRAAVLGLPTYGKGSIQTFLDLKDGSGLKLTTARFHAPSGRLLESSGITPDIPVEAFADEVIVAGAVAPAEPGESAGAEPAPGEAVNGSRSNGNRTLRARLADDHQFQVAHQTVRGWIGSK